jgi:hypothetical protein
MKLLMFTAAFVLIVSASAKGECDLDEVVGYTLVAKKQIEGRIEKGHREQDFEGGDFDRIIVFTDGTGVRCIGYGYQYAYMPDAYIFARGGLMKMCVESEFYDVGPIR